MSPGDGQSRSSDTYLIRYVFRLPTGGEHVIDVALDPVTLAARVPPPASGHAGSAPPAWTALGHQQCKNCPLKPAQSPHCPAALAIASVVATFADHWSIEEADVRVETPERTVSKATALQHGLSSLLGVLLATSGCPVLRKLRPLARYHLPFASEEETVFRAVSMYLVAQFLRAEDGKPADFRLDGLAELYREIGTVNRGLAARMRSAATKDANVNAVIVLDAFAKSLPDVIETRLAELKSRFAVWE